MIEFHDYATIYNNKIVSMVEIDEHKIYLSRSIKGYNNKQHLFSEINKFKI